MELYWKFAEAGDQYLGRVLALFDPNSDSFPMLPPHFFTDAPMDDEDIKEGMNICFGVILETHKDVHGDPTGVLLFLLASLVYNSEWLIRTAAQFDNHPFTGIELLNHPCLVESLKAKITMDGKKTDMTASGIPPHIQQAALCKDILFLNVIK